MRRLLAIVLASFLTVCSGSLFAADGAFYFLALADIHFTPFTACYSVRQRPCPMIQRLRAAPASRWADILSVDDVGVPRYRQDTNYILLQKNLEEAKRAAAKNNVDFALVLGDTIGHDFRFYYKKFSLDKSQDGYRDFVKKTLEFVNLELAKAFPSTNVFMVVGNNDTYSQNYQSVPGGDFFGQTSMLWSSLIKNAQDRGMMRSEFPVGGYYAVDVPSQPDLRLIVLNSVLFSVKSVSRGSAAAANAQLNWLHQQLQQAKNNHQKVLIALHIPPALDLYVTRRWHLFTLLQFWRPEYISRFKTELDAFYPQMIGIFSGHLHYDWSQTLMVGDRHDIPVISVPSVSPLFGNDPGFKVYHYSAADNHLDDFYTYTYPVRGRGVWSIEHAYNYWRGQLPVQ